MFWSFLRGFEKKKPPLGKKNKRRGAITPPSQATQPREVEPSDGSCETGTGLFQTAQRAQRAKREDTDPLKKTPGTAKEKCVFVWFDVLRLFL